MHHLHPQSSTVEYVCPGVDHTGLTINDRLVEVETIEVERHGAYAQCGEPDADNWPRCQEEVQGAGVVE